MAVTSPRGALWLLGANPAAAGAPRGDRGGWAYDFTIGRIGRTFSYWWTSVSRLSAGNESPTVGQSSAAQRLHSRRLTGDAFRAGAAGAATADTPLPGGDPHPTLTPLWRATAEQIRCACAPASGRTGGAGQSLARRVDVEPARTLQDQEGQRLAVDAPRHLLPISSRPQ